MMQKSISPLPRARVKEQFTCRCQSASTSSRDFYSPVKSHGDLSFFFQQLSLIIQNHFPDYQAKLITDDFPGLLQSIDSFFGNFLQHSSETLETREENLAKATSKLIKYEELLISKRKELEAEIKDWQALKTRERSELENEKTEMIKAKARLEAEINQFTKKIKDQDQKSARMIEEIENRRNLLLTEKLEHDKIKWSIEQRLRTIEEKEAIAELKLEMAKQEREVIASEKATVENNRMAEILLNDKIQLSSEAHCPHRRSSSIPQEEEPVHTQESRMCVSVFASPRSDLLNPPSLKSSFARLMKLKARLESSAAVLGELKEIVLPQLYELSEQLTNMLSDLADTKVRCEDALGRFEVQSSLYQEKMRKMDEASEEFNQRLLEVEVKDMSVSENKEKIELEIKVLKELKQKFDEEQEGFNSEKLAFYEEMSDERKKIESYYAEIGKKMKVLDLQSQEVRNMKNELEQKRKRKNEDMEKEQEISGGEELYER